MGNFSQSFKTFPRTFSSTETLFDSPLSDNPLITSQMKFPIVLNSLSEKPRVVPAGVPSRIPLVIVGFSGSKGMLFLLQVMFALPNDNSAVFPVTFFDCKSTKMT